MFLKSKQLKTLGRIFIGPSIFNINEPIMFGAPVVFNPLLMLPMWLNSIVGPAIVYIVMSLGWLNIPATLNQVGQVPVPVSTVMITQDMRCLLYTSSCLSNSCKRESSLIKVAIFMICRVSVSFTS